MEHSNRNQSPCLHRGRLVSAPQGSGQRTFGGAYVYRWLREASQEDLPSQMGEEQTKEENDD